MNLSGGRWYFVILLMWDFHLWRVPSFQTSFNLNHIVCSCYELKRVTELFTRMFHDPHSKVFAVFMEAFICLVTVHGCQLIDWFHICFVRLINKIGMDVLSPLQGRITMALDAMRYATGFVNSTFSFFTKLYNIPVLDITLEVFTVRWGAWTHFFTIKFESFAISFSIPPLLNWFSDLDWTGCSLYPFSYP